MKQNVQNRNIPNSKIVNPKSRRLRTEDIVISKSDISEFIKFQTSDEADYERHSLDFSEGQILYDEGDTKIGSNNISKGVVSMKPHGSSYYSRISQKNFTKDSKNGYLAVENHVVTVIDNSIYDGLATIEDAGFYSKTLHKFVNEDFNLKYNKKNFEDAELYSKTLDKVVNGEFNLKYNKKNYKKDSWTEVELSSKLDQDKIIETRIFAVETALERLQSDNLCSKSFCTKW